MRNLNQNSQGKFIIMLLAREMCVSFVVVFQVFFFCKKRRKCAMCIHKSHNDEVTLNCHTHNTRIIVIYEICFRVIMDFVTVFFLFTRSDSRSNISVANNYNNQFVVFFSFIPAKRKFSGQRAYEVITYNYNKINKMRISLHADYLFALHFTKFFFCCVQQAIHLEHVTNQSLTL